MSQPFESVPEPEQYPCESIQSNEPAPSKTGREALMAVQRDRFELLSAYVDSELSAAERREVEAWLASDPTAQQLHNRLLKLRRGFQSMPAPVSAVSTEQTVDRVMARLDRQPNLKLVWGGAAVVAVATALFAGLSPNKPLFQMAEQPTQPAATTVPVKSAEPEPLMIALDRPILQIPKSAVDSTQAAPSPFASPKSGDDVN